MRHDGLPCEIKKSVSPTKSLTAPGCQLTLRDQDAIIEITVERKMKLKDEMELILKEERLSSAASIKLAGKLGFAAACLYGRVGRSFLYPLYKHHRCGNAWIGWEMRQALDWWLSIIEIPLRREICSDKRKRWIVYSDANTTGLG